jgi:hypothetical protein
MKNCRLFSREPLVKLALHCLEGNANTFGEALASCQLSTHISSHPLQTRALERQALRAASIAAMSIFLICIIASKARLAAA